MSTAKAFIVERQRDGLHSLELVQLVLSDACRDRFDWRWAIVGLHAAVTSFSICVLNRGGSGTKHLNSQHRVRFLEYLESQEESEKAVALVASHLYANALAAVKWSTEFAATQEQRDALAWLNLRRNDYSHPQADSYIVLLADVPTRFLRVLEVIEILAIRGARFHGPMTPDAGSAEATIASLRDLLGDLHNQSARQADSG